MDTYLKELDEGLRRASGKFKDEVRLLRSSRPSMELIENLAVTYFESQMQVKQLGSLSFVPPREIRISVWDKGAAGPIMKAIEDAKAGFATSSDGNVIHATLSSLTDERRDELSRTVKKMAEAARIDIRSVRDDIMKKLRGAEDRGEITEDQSFAAKEKVQKRVSEANGEIEKALDEKLAEIAA